VFTSEQRDALRERVLRLADHDIYRVFVLPEALQFARVQERRRVWQAEHYVGAARGASGRPRRIRAGDAVELTRLCGAPRAAR